MALDPAYRIAFLDWLACATRGAREPAARAACEAAGNALLGRVAAAGTAGHVLDFDDTYLPGLAHLSAPTAPAALILGAERGATVAEVLAAYAAGFEAMAAIARASHPALYDRGWHPTAVCGVVGATTAASRVLGLERERERAAVGLALLRGGGLRSAFGSDGKSLQVGMASSAGVQAALLARAGASVDLERIVGAEAGFEEAFGARVEEADPAHPAVSKNWIKAYPCCLQAHGAIEAALTAREGDVVAADSRLEVAVHPVSRRAAPLDDVADGLEAKFSIPYLTAFGLLRGAPDVASFEAVDPAARALAAERISVRTDPELAEPEAVLRAGGKVVGRVEAALGSPQRPMGAEALAAKVRALAGERLDGVLDDPDRRASEILAALAI